MTTVYVAYPGEAGTRFDRAYYMREHLPLVQASWSRYGLESLAAFFPDGDGAGILAVCICGFRDDAAVRDSFSSPEAERVMADIPRFTDAQPTQTRAVPL